MKSVESIWRLSQIGGWLTEEFFGDNLDALIQIPSNQNSMPCQRKLNNEHRESFGWEKLCDDESCDENVMNCYKARH